MTHLLNRPRVLKSFTILLFVVGLAMIGQGYRIVSAEHGLPPTQQQTYDLVFSTSGQSMWGPGSEASPGTVTVDLIPNSLTAWDGTLDGTEHESIEGFTYGGGIEGGSSGSFGVEAEFTAGAGSVGVDAPISVTLDYPSAESFRPGDVVSITSSAPNLESVGAVITATRPQASASLNANFNLDTSANAEVCLGGCVDIPFFNPIDIGGEHGLAAFDEDGDASIAEIELFTVDPTNVVIDPFTEFVTGLGGNYGVWEVDVSSGVSGNSIVGTSLDSDFIDLELDLDKWYTRLVGGAPLGLGVPDFGQGASGSYDIVDVDATFNVSQHHRFEFAPGDVQIALAFPEPVDFWVYDDAILVSTGTSSTVTFLAGQRVDFTALEANMDVTPTFTMVNNTFANDTETYIDTGFETLALELNLDVDGFEVVGPLWLYGYYEFDWHWHDGHGPHCHDWNDTKTWCYDWHTYSGYNHDHGGWVDVYSDPIVFGGADIHEGPVHEEAHPVSRDIDDNLFDQDRAPWVLEGFTGLSGASFTLDPNHAPTAVVTGTITVDEGSLASFDGSSSSDLDNDPLTYRWDYGDGSPDGAGVATGHIYADDGPHTVTLSAHDGHGFGPGTDHLISVSNVAPTVDAGVDTVGVEGELFTLVSVDFHDAGTRDTHTSLIDWGDGTTSTGLVSETSTGPPGSALGLDGTVDGSHVYADNGMYTVVVTVTDDDGDFGSDSLDVVVANNTPTVDAGADQLVVEGEVVSLDPATFNDLGTLDSHTATVDWGDGTATEAGVVAETPFGPLGSLLGLDGTVAGSHVYADDGEYTVVVIVTDDDGDWSLDELTVTVGNVAPVIDAGVDATADEGTVFSLLSSTFNDSGTADTHTATIDWGDGTPVATGVVSEIPFGPPGSIAGLGGSVFGSHTYADDGAYVVLIEVTDDEGGVHADSLVVAVANVLPVISPSGDPEVIIFSPFEINSVFSDAGFDCGICGTLEDFTAEIDWDDGTVESVTLTEVSGGPGTLTAGVVAATHTYNWIGTYHVDVTLTDDDGGIASFTHEVEVLGGHQLNVEARRLLAEFVGESKDIEKALKELDDVIDGDYWEGGKLWIDEVHLQSKNGHKVFSDQKKTVDKLAKLLKEDAKGKGKKYVPLSPGAVDAINEAIFLILVSDQVIAQIAIEEAESTPVQDPKKQGKVDKELAKAHEDLSKAQEELYKGHHGHAIDNYRKAWEHAVKAIKHASPHKAHVGHGDDNDD